MTVRTPGPAFVPLAWGVLALGSALPRILWQELASNPAPLWLLLAQAGALLALFFAARHGTGVTRTAENPLRTKFAEGPFHALG